MTPYDTRRHGTVVNSAAIRYRCASREHDPAIEDAPVAFRLILSPVSLVLSWFARVQVALMYTRDAPTLLPYA